MWGVGTATSSSVIGCVYYSSGINNRLTSTQNVIFMPPSLKIGILWSGRPSVRPLFFNITSFAWRNISVLSGGISMKPATDILRASRNCWKRFRGQRSKVTVIARLKRYPSTYGRPYKCVNAAEAYISTICDLPISGTHESSTIYTVNY